MWNIFFIGFLLPTVLCDVSHLGYGSHTPSNPLELPGAGTVNNGAVTGLGHGHGRGHGHGATAGGNVHQVPDGQGLGSNAGGVISRPDQSHDHSHDHHHHHYHGEDGKYNPHDDGTGWDIRKSVPGEPGQDYPTYDSVPSTSFTCKEKVPGYYADEETRCQAFRVCTTNSLKTYNSFLCPNGSLFNQRFLTCDWWMNVDCASSSEFYYKNADIGKMPTGQQLMYAVSKMIEAPNKNPYYFNQQQQNYLDTMLNDNLIQGTGAVNDLYLPPKVLTTAQTYVPPPPPTRPPTQPPTRPPTRPPTTTTTTSTTTTTTTTTPKPVTINTSNLNRVDNQMKQTITQDTEESIFNRENLNQQTIQNVKNQYIPPAVPTIDQSSLSNVKNQQNIQVQGELHVSKVLKTSPELHVSPKVEPTLHLSKQNTVINNPQPLFVSQTSKDNKLFTSKEISTAQKQQGGNVFVSPILSSKPSKTDGQLFTSKVMVTNNTQPLFVSQVKDNKPAMGNQLFISQVKPINNAQPLFTSQVAGRPNKTDQLFVSQEKKDGQLFTSQLKPTNNAQPLFTSQVAMKQTKPFVSPERPLTNKNLTAPNKQKDQLFLSQINETSASGVFNQNKIDQSSIGGSTGGYNYPKQTPVSTAGHVTTQIGNANQIPSLTVTKEQTHTVTHSEKTTHVFQNVGEGPEKIPLLGNTGTVQTAHNINTGPTGQVQQQQGVQQNTLSGVQQQYGVQQQTSSTGLNNQQQFKVGQQSDVGFQNTLGIQQHGVQQQYGVQQQTSTGLNNQQQFKVGQQSDVGFQNNLGIQQHGVQQQGVQQQFGVQQQTSTGLNNQQPFTIGQQSDVGFQNNLGIQQGQSNTQQPSNFKLPQFTNEQALAQIDKIQQEYQGIVNQQNKLQNFGQGLIEPRKHIQNVPNVDFGKQFNNQGIQSNQFGVQSYPVESYIQNQGYQYNQPHFNEQNFQHFNLHGKNNGQNFNVEVAKDGHTHNYKGESVAQHSNGHTHSSFSGHNIGFKESTKVDIVPSVGYHLNDEQEKNSYISAVLSGLIYDGPSFHSSESGFTSNQFSPSFSAPNTFAESQFVPSDVRFSSYHGPSSYLAPQGSIQRLPSDSGYHYR